MKHLLTPPSLPKKFRRSIDLCAKYRPVFTLSVDELGCCKNAEATFPLQPGTRPIDRAPYRTSPRVQKQSDDQVDKLFKQGIIEERTNAWGFLFLLSARLMGHHGPVLTTVTLFTVI